MWQSRSLTKFTLAVVAGGILSGCAATKDPGPDLGPDKRAMVESVQPVAKLQGTKVGVYSTFPGAKHMEDTETWEKNMPHVFDPMAVDALEKAGAAQVDVVDNPQPGNKYDYVLKARFEQIQDKVYMGADLPFGENMAQNLIPFNATETYEITANADTYFDLADASGGVISESNTQISRKESVDKHSLNMDRQKEIGGAANRMMLEEMRAALRDFLQTVRDTR